jgi:radical SAM superfamily enzyme YgiQ (UPF0313 family)
MIVLTEPLIPPTDIFGMKYPPLALACLSTALKAAGENCRVVVHEATVPDEQWLRDVLACRPRVVGFSVFMGYKLETAFRLCNLLKKADPSIRTLWGGVHPSLCPKDVLQDASVDWVCIGPGEQTIVDIARFLRGEIDLQSIRSLARRENGNVVIHEPGLPRADKSVTRPDWTSFDPDAFAFQSEEGRKTIGFLASRGCVFECGFCYINAFYGRAWQPSKLDDVKAEMLQLRERHGIRGFIFLDDLFFTNRRRALELLQWMASEDLAAHAIDIRLDQVSREVLEALRAAHCKGIFIGVESANDRVLKFMKKGSGRAELLAAMEILKDYPDILVWMNCIVGTPTETFSEMQDTISTMGQLGRRENTLVNLNAFYPIPGTDLYPVSLEHGFAEPRSLRGWTELADARVMNLDHFPGRLTAGQTRHLNRAGRYLRMLFRMHKGTRRSLPHRAATGFFSSVASARLRSGVLGMPVDLVLYEAIRRWNNRGEVKA